MSLFEELRQRNIFKVGAAYLVAAWLIELLADPLLERLGAPGWAHGALLGVLALGFPVAVVFAWNFEVTATGFSRDYEVSDEDSLRPTTGQKLNVLIISMLMIIVGLLAWERMRGGEDGETDTRGSTANPPAISATHWA